MLFNCVSLTPDASSGFIWPFVVSTYPAESQEEVHPTRSLHTVSELPVHQVLPGEHQEAEAHGHQQHVKDPRHVVDVQLTAHHLEGGRWEIRRVMGEMIEERQKRSKKSI